MSNKHFRRIAKEEETFLTADKDENSPQVNSADKLEHEPSDEEPKVVNKFALLEENGEESNKSESDTEKMESTSPVPPVRKSKKKNKKKAAKTAAKPLEQELDEMQLISTITQEDRSLANLKEQVMKVDPRCLDPDAELRRLLGRTFGPGGAEGAAAGGRPALRALRGSRLVKVHPNWPARINAGFSMKELDEKNGIKSFRFTHGVQYQEQQQLFWNFQAHLDFENIMNTVLAVNPFHLDSLLLMAENMRIQDNSQSAIDVLEMGIFACERAFHSNFRIFARNCRLGYEWWENRAFYLLLHRYLLTLIQRNCFATALEFTKLIYIKDESDPLGVLLMIDSLALRAKNYTFLINFYDTFREEKNLDMLPNFLYSVALAHFFVSELSPSTANNLEQNQIESAGESAQNFLELALSRFPFLLGQILDKLQIHADSAVENNPLLNTLAFYRETEGLRLISDIYLHHSIELWRQPNVLSWLETTTHKILPQLSSSTKVSTTVKMWSKKRGQCFVGIPRNVLRHAVIHSVSRAQADDGAENWTEVDPCPPRPSYSDYVSERALYLLSNEQNSNVSDDGGTANGALVEFMRTLVPDEFQPQLDQIGETVSGYVAGFVARLSGRR